MSREITLVGAGLTGLACALYLARRGYAVRIFEARSDEEIHSRDFIEGKTTGRSMSMDLSARGLHALQEIGAFSEATSKSVPMTHRVFHDRLGRITRVPYGRNEKEHILTVSRNWLYQSLLNQTKKFRQIQIIFQKSVESLDLEKLILDVLDKRTGILEQVKADIVIGTDGARSKVRAALEESGQCEFRKTKLKQAYKELTIPSSFAGALDFNAMHVWARDQFMLVAQPNSDRSFTCAVLLPEKDYDPSFESIRTWAQVESLFSSQFGDVRRFMPKLEDEFLSHPTGSFGIIQGSRWSYQNRVLILGDAAHSMVPFFGQGINCCFEDCTVLNECLSLCHDDWDQALPLFESKRVHNANAISRLSFENYPELHQSDICEKVLLKKQIENALGRRYYDRYVSYHNLVCFDRVPYAYAKACKEIQEPLLDRLASSIETTSDLNWNLVDQEIEHYRAQIASLSDEAHEHKTSSLALFGS